MNDKRDKNNERELGEITSFEKVIKDETAMMRFGAKLSDACEGGEIVFLHGELGAGKTTLVRGFMRQLGHHGAVKSPTYTLVEQYVYQGKTVYHFDLYRLSDGEELEYMGIRDYFTGNAICLIEWPEQGSGYLPNADIDLHIYYTDDDQRRILLTSISERGKRLLCAINGL